MKNQWIPFLFILIVGLPIIGLANTLPVDSIWVLEAVREEAGEKSEVLSFRFNEAGQYHKKIKFQKWDEKWFSADYVQVLNQNQIKVGSETLAISGILSIQAKLPGKSSPLRSFFRPVLFLLSFMLSVAFLLIVSSGDVQGEEAAIPAIGALASILTFSLTSRRKTLRRSGGWQFRVRKVKAE